MAVGNGIKVFVYFFFFVLDLIKMTMTKKLQVLHEDDLLFSIQLKTLPKFCASFSLNNYYIDDQRDKLKLKRCHDRIIARLMFFDAAVCFFSHSTDSSRRHSVAVLVNQRQA